MSSRSILKASFIYFILAMIFGVFHREITKATNFTGQTTLSTIHAHLLSFGMILFLILFVLSLNSKFAIDKSFKRFFVFYNISFPFMIMMLVIRGIVQVLQLNLNSTQNAIISGFSGLSHIFIFLAIIQLFMILFKFCKGLDN